MISTRGSTSFKDGTMAIAAFLFFLPWLQIASVFCIGWIAIHFLLKRDFSFPVFISRPIGLLLISYYFVFVLGMFYTENMKYGFFDLQIKLSFLVMPFLLFFPNAKKNDFYFLARSFITGCLFSFLFFLIRSCIAYEVSRDPQLFFYMKLSKEIHPTYLSFYYNFALILLLNDVFLHHIRKWVRILIFIVLYTGILLLSSRTAITVTYITLLAFPILYFGKRIFSKKNITFYFIAVFLVSGFLFISLSFNHRFEQVENVVESKVNQSVIQSTLPEEENSTNVRLKLWKYSWQLFKQHPFIGVGTGDIKDELDKVYLENNFTYGAEKHFNPHNQFFHTAISTGLLGLIILLGLVLILFRNGFLYKEPLLIIFGFIIFANCMTESVLERQAGILFFAAFAIILESNAVHNLQEQRNRND